MKTKKMVFALIGFSLFLAWGIQPLEAGTSIKKLGTAPFFKAKALKADQVLPILTRLKKDVKLGFSQAGAEALYEPFMKQLQAQKPETSQHPARSDAAVDDLQEKRKGPDHQRSDLGR